MHITTASRSKAGRRVRRRWPHSVWPAAALLTRLQFLVVDARRPPRRRAPGGTLAANNAAYLAADLKAPGGSLNASGSTFVQPFFTLGVLQVHRPEPGSPGQLPGRGIAAPASRAFQAGTVAFAASDVPMSASDLAKMPANSGPVIQIPDILGGVADRLQPARRLHPAEARRPDAGRHLRRLHHHVERLADRRPQPGGAACRPTPSPPRSGPTARAPPTSSPTTWQSAARPAWTLGTSKTIAWPSTAVQTPKNSGVAASIQSTPYSIGYVELSYAIQNKMTLCGGQERGRRLRGAEPGHGGGRCRPEDRGDAHRASRS